MHNYFIKVSPEVRGEFQREPSPEELSTEARDNVAESIENSISGFIRRIQFEMNRYPFGKVTAYLNIDERIMGHLDGRHCSSNVAGALAGTYQTTSTDTILRTIKSIDEVIQPPSPNQNKLLTQRQFLAVAEAFDSHGITAHRLDAVINDISDRNPKKVVATAMALSLGILDPRELWIDTKLANEFHNLYQNGQVISLDHQPPYFTSGILDKVYDEVPSFRDVKIPDQSVGVMPAISKGEEVDFSYYGVSSEIYASVFRESINKKLSEEFGENWLEALNIPLLEGNTTSDDWCDIWTNQNLDRQDPDPSLGIW